MTFSLVNVHPGQDGKVQVAIAKTADGVFKRHIVKLVLFLQEEDKENNSVLVGSISECSA